MQPRNVVPTTPAETLEISPEGLEVANAYLQNPDILAVANDLGISTEIVTQLLDRREVKAYIDHVFFNLGFNNRFRVREVMDTIIKKKLQEMDEADIGSSKDIIEIMTLSHKMTMEQMDKEIQLKKIELGKAGPKNQLNVQINEAAGNATKYSSLLEKILNNNVQ